MSDQFRHLWLLSATLICVSLGTVAGYVLGYESAEANYKPAQEQCDCNGDDITGLTRRLNAIDLRLDTATLLAVGEGCEYNQETDHETQTQ